MRLVLVGEMNPYGADPYFALYDEPPQSAGGRMRRLVLGMSHENYVALPRYNLCAGAWSMARARERAADICADHPGDVIVLLGRKVAAAFDVALGPFGRMVLHRGLGTNVLVSLPHPSGRCRAWNEPHAVSRAREALRCEVPDLPIGEVE